MRFYLKQLTLRSSVHPLKSNLRPFVNTVIRAQVLSHFLQFSSPPRSLLVWLAAELKRRVSVQRSAAPLPMSSLASDVHKDVLVPNVACRSPAWRNAEWIFCVTISCHKYVFFPQTAIMHAQLLWLWKGLAIYAPFDVKVTRKIW